MRQSEYFVMSASEKLAYNLKRLAVGFGKGFVGFFKGLPRGVGKLFSAIGGFFTFLGKSFATGDFKTRLSFAVMGTGNALRGQLVKGLLYFVAELAYIWYMTASGVKNLMGLRNLGTVSRGWHFDEELGIDVMRENGDNSMLILLFGTLTIFVTVAFLILWVGNIRSASEAQTLQAKGRKLPRFFEELRHWLDDKFHKTLLIVPTVGILVFTIVPLVYMILIAFTNYDQSHQVPANLFTWVGLDNFKTMLGSGSMLSKTFWPVLGWTLVWAVFATGLNYIFGIMLAMLINKKGVKLKGLFRTLFVVAIAVPQFVSLLVMKNILAEQGPVNVLLAELGLIDRALPFLTEAGWARVVVIAVNLWIGIPYTMLITSGILMNIPEDLYEAAVIDGASPALMFRKITMPYVIFVTTPYLITQFIGNINNFNVIYFLTGGNPGTLDYYQAGKTDLLVTWLYKLTVNSRDYCYASTIGILVFIICAVFALISFRRSNSYKNEEAFQ